MAKELDRLKEGYVFDVPKGLKLNATVLRWVEGNLVSERINDGNPVVANGNKTPYLKDTHFVVTDARMDGGDPDPHDYWPDAWHVTAKALGLNGEYSSDGLQIDFYQGGPFTTANSIAIPVRHVMKRTYI